MSAESRRAAAAARSPRSISGLACPRICRARRRIGPLRRRRLRRCRLRRRCLSRRCLRRCRLRRRCLRRRLRRRVAPEATGAFFERLRSGERAALPRALLSGERRPTVLGSATSIACVCGGSSAACALRGPRIAARHRPPDALSGEALSGDTLSREVLSRDALSRDALSGGPPNKALRLPLCRPHARFDTAVRARIAADLCGDAGALTGTLRRGPQRPALVRRRRSAQIAAARPACQLSLSLPAGEALFPDLRLLRGMSQVFGRQPIRAGEVEVIREHDLFGAVRAVLRRGGGQRSHPRRSHGEPRRLRARRPLRAVGAAAGCRRLDSHRFIVRAGRGGQRALGVRLPRLPRAFRARGPRRRGLRPARPRSHAGSRSHARSRARRSALPRLRRALPYRVPGRGADRRGL